MKYLALDTSGKALTVVCSNGEKIYKTFDAECGTRHSVSLMSEIERLSSEAFASLNDVEFFAVVTGAGSFTGIRIGVSTVKALCLAYGKPCLAVTSFDTLAYNKKAGEILAVIDAGHNGFYAAGYKDGKQIMSPSFIMKEELLTLSEKYTVLCEKPIDGINAEIVSTLNGLIEAVNVLSSFATENLDEIIPVYVRKSQAEEGR